MTRRRKSAPPPLKRSEAPALPPPGTELCTLDSLGPRGARTFVFGEGADRIEFFVQRHDDRVVAYVNDCPHAHWPLDFKPDRFLDRDERYILCANHGALFRIEDGACVRGPCPGQFLRAVSITLEDGRVLMGD